MEDVQWQWFHSTAVYQHSSDGGFPKVVESFSFSRQESVSRDTDGCVFAPTTALSEYLVSQIWSVTPAPTLSDLVPRQIGFAQTKEIIVSRASVTLKEDWSSFG